MNLNRVTEVDDFVPLRNALISVADKRGIESFVSGLWSVAPDVRIYSSGGTYNALREVASRTGRENQLIEIAAYTGQPEMQGGLVKSLDFKIYLGLLSETYNDDHRRDIERTKAISFDLTVCNFYPFEGAASEGGATIEDLRTHIDIGGPAMLRASAKNFLRVTAVSTPDDYQSIIDEVRTHGGTTLEYRARLAAKAFRYTSHYENAIAGILGSYVEHDSWSSVYNVKVKDE